MYTYYIMDPVTTDTISEPTVEKPTEAQPVEKPTETDTEPTPQACYIKKKKQCNS